MKCLIVEKSKDQKPDASQNLSAIKKSKSNALLRGKIHQPINQSISDINDKSTLLLPTENHIRALYTKVFSRALTLPLADRDRPGRGKKNGETK